MNINININNFRQSLPSGCKLIAVSKTQPLEKLEEAYAAGQRIFGENKVQEVVPKFEALPKDIEWHFIGHLQSNKVKYIAPFIHLIHSVDSARLLEEINKQAQKAELGFVPFFVLAKSVNWLTTSASPASVTLRFHAPSSSAKSRRPATFPASHSMSSAASLSSTPSRISSPRPIAAIASPPTLTDADRTR